MSRTTSLAVMALLVLLDYGSKWAAEYYLPLEEQVDVLPFWSLYLTYNDGVAFSMLTSMNDGLLIALTMLIIGFILWVWQTTKHRRLLTHLGFALIVGGAVGNLIDRVTAGHVIDFLLFSTSSWSFAVFNLADSFITLGAASIILDEILDFRRQRSEKSAIEK